MIFQRTTDRELIRSVICHPKIYPAIHDDDPVPVEQWEPINHPLVGYVAIREGEELLGVAICSAHSRYEWEIHNCLLPSLGWKKRLLVAKEFFEWLTIAGCRRVLGKVVASNRYALVFNKSIGMEMFGVDRKSFMRNGQLQDQYYFGLSLPLQGRKAG